MLTPDDILEALTQAYTLGLRDGRAMSCSAVRRELVALVEEYTAKLTGDLSPAIGGQ